MSRKLKPFRQVISEDGMEANMWQKEPHIGWWNDPSKKHMVMYHGTHDKNVDNIKKNGLNVGGPTKTVSMTHDPYTAHAYASMTGGEAHFRAAGGKAQSVPHEHRSVVVAHIPREWADKHMDKSFAGNMDRTKMSDKSKYEAHKSAGGKDHEYYQTSELRFHKPIPAHFIKGVIKKPVK